MTKDAIIENAISLFADKGYDGTSMEDIAKSVGIKKASLYSHYSGKENILSEVFKTVLNDYTRHLDEIILNSGAMDFRERIFNIFFQYVLYFLDEKIMNFWIKIYLSPPDFIKKEVMKKTYKVEMDFIMRLCDIFREAIDNKTVRKQKPLSIVLALYYMMTGFGMTAAFYKEKKLKESVKEYLDVFWNGIKYQ